MSTQFITKNANYYAKIYKFFQNKNIQNKHIF